MNAITLEDLRAMRGYEARIANDEGKAATKNAREALESALRELASYEESYDRAETAKDRAKTLEWVAGALSSNILGNTRIDLIAGAAGKLHALAAREETLQMLFGEGE